MESSNAFGGARFNFNLKLRNCTTATWKRVPSIPSLQNSSGTFPLNRRTNPLSGHYSARTRRMAGRNAAPAASRWKMASLPVTAGWGFGGIPIRYSQILFFAANGGRKEKNPIRESFSVFLRRLTIRGLQCEAGMNSRLANRRPPIRSTALGHFILFMRSEEHTSELQSLRHLVCRLLLEKKKTR